MEEKNEIYSALPNPQAWEGIGVVEESKNSRIIKLERGNGYIGSNTNPTEVQTITKLILPVPPSVSYAPTKIQTKLGNDIYTFTIFPEYFSLKDHICKHVFNPFEMWNQLYPSLNIQSAKTLLLARDCYSRYLGSSYNNWCKWCPNLNDEKCDEVLRDIINLYISTISSTISFSPDIYIVISANDGTIYFLDEFGVLIVCKPDGRQFNYRVVSAYRDEISSSTPVPSKKIYFDKMLHRVTEKYLGPGGHILAMKNLRV